MPHAALSWWSKLALATRSPRGVMTWADVIVGRRRHGRRPRRERGVRAGQMMAGTAPDREIRACRTGGIGPLYDGRRHTQHDHR
jgi:hypothetical protein